MSGGRAGWRILHGALCGVGAMLPLAVLALGALVARALIRSRKPPERVKVTPPVSRVEVVEAPPSTDPVTVVATRPVTVTEARGVIVG